jgi:hypothetical protein
VSTHSRVLAPYHTAALSPGEDGKHSHLIPANVGQLHNFRTPHPDLEMVYATGWTGETLLWYYLLMEAGVRARHVRDG